MSIILSLHNLVFVFKKTSSIMLFIFPCLSLVLKSLSRLIGKLSFKYPETSWPKTPWPSLCFKIDLPHSEINGIWITIKVLEDKEIILIYFFNFCSWESCLSNMTKFVNFFKSFFVWIIDRGNLNFLCNYIGEKIILWLTFINII